MVSRIIALKALSKLTGIQDLNVFHKVLFINQNDVGADYHSRTKSIQQAGKILEDYTIKMQSGEDDDENQEVPDLDTHGKVKWKPGVCECYMVCSKTHVFFLDIRRIKDQSYSEEIATLKETKKREEEAKLKSTDFKEEETAKLGEIQEDNFDDEVQTDGAIPGYICSFRLTDILSVSTSSTLADRFGISFDRYTADKCNPSIPTFIALSSCHRKKIIEDLQISHDTAMISFGSELKFLQPKPFPTKIPDGWPEFRHPAIMMFNTIPAELKENMKPFYRCGYLFLGPKRMEDTSMANLYNRHSSTYTFPASDAAGGVLSVEKRKHLLVRVMPEKPIRSSMPDSNLNFHLWVESVAWAMAQDEVRQEEGSKGGISSDKIFIPERGVYRKKINITGDESMYHCFRLHIYTPHREIGVIGVRRKFIPPLIDCFQDMIFVLKGRNNMGEWVSEVNFMPTLERMVDTLSPSAMDWRADSYWAKMFKEPPQESHPTYIDKFIIQQQANALLYNHDVYSWLRNRPAFKILPRMTFNGKECHLLAEQFCRSTCKAAYDGKVSSKDSKHDGKSTAAMKKEANKIMAAVNDPLSIIKRFEASATVMLEEQKVSPKIKTILLNNWRSRVSKYFAHVVDCYMPSHITIVKLARLSTKSGSLSAQNKASCHKWFSVSPKVKTDISHMECNEVVLLKLLSASYFERLNEGKDAYQLTELLKNLLYRKASNLDIVRAVCRKIRRKNQHDIPKLITPLLVLAHMGNAYAQTYAFQALVAIAKVGAPARTIVENKGVEIAMHVIYTSPSRELVQAAVTFLETVISKSRDDESIMKLSKTYFLDKLVNLLGPQLLGQRHDAPLLSAVARLIMHICTQNYLILFYMVVKGVIKELIAIVQEDGGYYRILIPISACLGTIFFRLQENKARFRTLVDSETSVLNDALQEQAQHLVTVLKNMMNPEGLQVALNVLIVLKHMVKLVAPEEKKEGPLQKDRRKELLMVLDSKYAFEHVLNRCKEVASRCEDMKQAANVDDSERKMWATIVAGVRSAADELLVAVDDIDDEDDSQAGRSSIG
eukprot:jgi/Bigna1/75359/fgenesh1_pg.34_\